MSAELCLWVYGSPVRSAFLVSPSGPLVTHLRTDLRALLLTPVHCIELHDGMHRNQLETFNPTSSVPLAYDMRLPAPSGLQGHVDLIVLGPQQLSALPAPRAPDPEPSTVSSCHEWTTATIELQETDEETRKILRRVLQPLTHLIRGECRRLVTRRTDNVLIVLECQTENWPHVQAHLLDNAPQFKGHCSNFETAVQKPASLLPCSSHGRKFRIRPCRNAERRSNATSELGEDVTFYKEEDPTNQ